MTNQSKAKPRRKLTITACVVKKQGWTNGRQWTLHEVRAIDADGYDVDEDLIAFDPLPIGQEQEFEVERRERQWKGRTYVSFTVSVPKQKLVYPQVPDGRYAIVGPDGEVGLYRVWVGSRYDPPPIHVYVVKGTEKGERLTPKTLEVAVLTEIAKDPGKAALEFGKRTGSCSKCGAELDKNLSRHLGIGPTCMKHWFDRDTRLSKMAAARKELRDQGIDPEESFDPVDDSIGTLGSWSNVA